MKRRLVLNLSVVLLLICTSVIEGRSQLINDRIHYWGSDKIKAAYIGTGLQYSVNHPVFYSLLNDLYNRNYNLLLLTRGGIKTILNPTTQAIDIVADIPDISGDPDYIDFQYFPQNHELIFSVSEKVFNEIKARYSVPYNFIEKIAFYKDLFRGPFNNWVLKYEKKYRSVHLNLECWRLFPEDHTDDEAATIAMTELFHSQKEVKWNVSVSFGNDWSIDNIIRMYNAGASKFHYQAYNLGVISSDILENIENWRNKFHTSNILTADHLVITFPYYGPYNTVAHFSVENITSYYGSFKNYVYLESLGGAGVYLYAGYENSLPYNVDENEQKNYAERNDFDNFDKLFNINIKVPENLNLMLSDVLTVAWDPNTEADLEGYGIYFRKNIPGPPYSLFGYISIDTLSDPLRPIFSIDHLERNSTQFVSVTAYNKSGNESGFSKSVCVQLGTTSIPCPDSTQSSTPGDDGTSGNSGGGGGGGCFITISKR